MSMFFYPAIMLKSDGWNKSATRKKQTILARRAVAEIIFASGNLTPRDNCSII